MIFYLLVPRSPFKIFRSIQMSADHISYLEPRQSVALTVDETKNRAKGDLKSIYFKGWFSATSGDGWAAGESP